jgi:hypothetical protein
VCDANSGLVNRGGGVVIDTQADLPHAQRMIDLLVNADGSVDIYFGPQEPEEKGNWIRTVSGKGWFAYLRFYDPTEAYYDQTWKLEDIVAVRQ